MGKDKKNKQSKPTLTPEEIEARKALAASRAALKKVESVLDRINIAITNKMPHCCFEVAEPPKKGNNKEEVESTGSGVDANELNDRLQLIVSTSTTEEKYKPIENMVLLLMSKSFNSKPVDVPELDDFPSHSIALSLYMPYTFADKISVDELLTIIIGGSNHFLNRTTTKTDQGCIVSVDFYVEYPDKINDTILASFMQTIKDKGIYIEEDDSDDDIVGEMADLEW